MTARARRFLSLFLFASAVSLLVIISFAAGLVLSPRFLPQNTITLSAKDKELGVIWEVWHILQEEFVKKDALDPEKMKTGAINGIISTLDDPHTTYLDPTHLQAEQTGLRGAFDGIGAQVTVADGHLTIIAPIAQSPAERAGILPGDWILEVDGQSTAQMSLTEAVDKIRGPRGTSVRLQLQRGSGGAHFEVVIAREEIKADSVFLKMLPDGVAYLRLAQFTQRTGDEVKAKLQEAKDAGAKSIVLDLRNNPGGILDVTVDVASQFLKDGVVLYQVDAQGSRQVWEVRRGGLATDLPLAVLVNEGSASGSEVLAGAVQDAARAPLIGQKTFGKGSVNHVRPLSDGSAIYVTFARWHTPKDREIEGVGLEPDIVIGLSEDHRKAGRDPQLERALEYLRTGK